MQYDIISDVSYCLNTDYDGKSLPTTEFLPGLGYTRISPYNDYLAAHLDVMGGESREGPYNKEERRVKYRQVLQDSKVKYVPVTHPTYMSTFMNTHECHERKSRAIQAVQYMERIRAGMIDDKSLKYELSDSLMDINDDSEDEEISENELNINKDAIEHQRYEGVIKEVRNDAHRLGYNVTDDQLAEVARTICNIQKVKSNILEKRR